MEHALCRFPRLRSAPDLGSFQNNFFSPLALAGKTQAEGASMLSPLLVSKVEQFKMRRGSNEVNIPGRFLAGASQFTSGFNAQHGGKALKQKTAAGFTPAKNSRNAIKQPATPLAAVTDKEHAPL